ncbi:MAG: hypothetical protein COA49_10115 [Bacteroidetes bacterium]|nr:MAG: hypothetical protein COA49_10115 [Bacteroidota bacterium]
MKVSILLNHFSFGLLLLFSSLVISSVGCLDNHKENLNLHVTQPHPGLPGFDWSSDPLEVSINETLLKSEMGMDTLDLVIEDLYTYLHTMNTGDSTDWKTHINHFPLHMFNDTSMLNKQFAQTKHWRENGFINRINKADIQFASNWIIEEKQMVAILGYNVDYYQDFLPNFEGNPAGMKFLLEDKFGRDNIQYNSYEEINELGDTILIRNWHANTYSTIFVLSPLDSLESLHFCFLPQGFNKADFSNKLMKSETMLGLLRQSREFKKSTTNEN